jgi:hypothetical protein
MKKKYEWQSFLYFVSIVAYTQWWASARNATVYFRSLIFLVKKMKTNNQTIIFPRKSTLYKQND